MLRHALLALAAIAILATLPALSPQRGSVVTHAERVTARQATPFRVAALETGLPQTWCGTPSTADQTVNATTDGAPKFKFYYVRAADQPDRFSDAANFLQKNVAALHSFLLNATSGSRTLSLDLGTPCGKSYLDITSVTLPGSLASYQDGSGEVKSNEMLDLLRSITSDVASRPRHHVYMLDQFQPAGTLKGMAEQAGDDSPGENNANNLPGFVSFVATPTGSFGQTVNGAFARVMLHELSHTMGAVQDSAPNTSGAGHCTDGLDVMCYADGGEYEASYSESVCPSTTIAGIDRAYDCNRDDYFNPAPQASSYLASKWNVFNSKYLLRCTSSDPFCLGATTDTPPRTATNDLYLYKNGVRGEKIGTVTATGTKLTDKAYARNTVKMSSLRLFKGKWKITICFRQSETPAVCLGKRKNAPRSGSLSIGQIYANSEVGPYSAWGSVTVKPVSSSLKKRGLEVRTVKPITATYSLDF